jgi:hypothetical protein
VKTDLLRSGLMNWTHYIIHPSQLVWSPWRYGYAISNGISYSLGLVHIALAIAGFVFAMRLANRTRRLDAVVFAGATMVFALLATNLSWTVWAHVTTLQYLVYPWRSLCVPALFMPLLALYAFYRIGTRATFFAILVLVLANVAHTAPKGTQTFDDAYYYPDSVARLGINTTTREEYEPRTVTHRPPFDSTLLRGIDSSPAVTLQSVSSDSQSFSVNAIEPALMQDSTFDYPGWTVLIDDREITTTPMPGSGEITFNLPAGTHNVRVELRPTPIRRWSLYISLATGAFLALLVIWALLTTQSADKAISKTAPKSRAKRARHH